MTNHSLSYSNYSLLSVVTACYCRCAESAFAAAVTAGSGHLLLLLAWLLDHSFDILNTMT